MLTKISTLLIASVATFSTLQAHAAETDMKDKDLHLPNLMSTKNINAFYKHTYKYHGISLDSSKTEVYKKWSKPNKITKSNGNWQSLIYGKNNNVTLNYQPNKKQVTYIEVKDKSMKYEYSKLYPLYKKKFFTIDRNGKKYIGNDSTSITFEQKNGHYYATEFMYISYTHSLE